ncbi:MAG: aldo/keto reductase [Gammaproteobacteria bacterium]|jgi:aryl-alcohol dehydrogenase-like predicted oxidoreductase|nr:aldo/keto reductase [Gammaproteobacteria bacterium]
MKYKILGRSGLRVSELCLGAMTFGGEGGTGATEAVSRQIYTRFRDAGGNFIDTANIYNAGESERITGRLVASERAGVVLASKYSMTMNPADPNAGGNHRKNLTTAVAASLKRLGTDYLDLLWVHGWDQLSRIDEVMRALDDLVRRGLVLHVGVSNMPAWLISQANTLAAERGWTPFAAVQMHYNLVERSIESDFFDLCAAQDMAVTAWSPLAGGLLTGKFNRDADPAAAATARLTQAEYGPAMLATERLEIAEGLSRLAQLAGCSAPQLALAWLLHRPQGGVIPILGARTLAQFEDNLGCLDINLNPTQLDELDGLAPARPAYPASLFRTPFYRRMLHGEHQLVDAS